MEIKIRIDGEDYDTDDIDNGRYSVLPMLKDGRMEFYLAESSEAAGEKARERWQDMANDDPKEFACIIGEERLVQWAMGHSDGFGISGMEDFLEAVERVPEEEFAGYDGQEREVDGFLLQWEDTVESDDEEVEDETIDRELYITHAQASDMLSMTEDDIENMCSPFAELQAEHPYLTIETAQDIIDAVQGVVDEMGFVPQVAYRHN